MSQHPPFRFRLRMTRILRPLALLAAVAAFAGDAAAQLEFAGIAWGTPPDSARAAIQRAGYTLRGQDQEGDWLFGAPGRLDLSAVFDSAGLVFVDASWLQEPDSLSALHDRMADSLAAVVGAPDSLKADEHGRYMVWRRGGASLELVLHPSDGAGDAVLFVRHTGPGYAAEFERRAVAWQAREEDERARGRADTLGLGGWREVFSGSRELVWIDTVKFTRLGPQRYRARFRGDLMRPRRLENGMMYSATVREGELDCAAGRTRLHRTIPLYYDLRALPPIDVPPAGRQWVQPPPGSPDEAALRAACSVLARRP